MLIALSHGRRADSPKGSGGGAGLKSANIRVDVNGPTRSLLSDEARSHQSIPYFCVLDAQIKNGSFEITYLPSEITAIGCRWVLKQAYCYFRL